MSNRSLRVAAAALAAALALLGYLAQDVLDPRLRGALGAVCFVAIVAAASSNLRGVNWRTVGWGIALQLLLAFIILKFEVNGVRPGYELFSAMAGGVKRFLEFTSLGSAVRVRRSRQPSRLWARCCPARLRLRLHGPADDHLRLLVLHRPLLLRHPAVRRRDDGAGDDVPAAHERRGDAVGCSQRVHGPDRGPDHREAVRPADDAVGAARDDGGRAWPRSPAA